MKSCDVFVISVVRDFEMYKKCVGGNSCLKGCILESIDNRDFNENITVCYNRAIERHLKEDAWLVFCHEDFRFLENPRPLLESVDKNSIYGPIGGTLAKRLHPLFGEVWSGEFRGVINESDKDGSGVHELGVPAPVGTSAETLDCQCVIVHTSLLAGNSLRFDEKLTFDLYAEDFCMSAWLDHAVVTRILPVKCQHYSRGNIAPRLFEQLEYLRGKYPRYEAFGAVGHFIGAGRTPLRRFQKKVKIILDRHCGSLVEWLLKMV